MHSHYGHCIWLFHWTARLARCHGICTGIAVSSWLARGSWWNNCHSNYSNCSFDGKPHYVSLVPLKICPLIPTIINGFTSWKSFAHTRDVSSLFLVWNVCYYLLAWPSIVELEHPFLVNVMLECAIWHQGYFQGVCTPTLSHFETISSNLNGLQVIVLGGSTSTMLGKLGVAEAAHSNNLDADVSSQLSMCTHLAVGSCNTSQVCLIEENCTCYSAKCFGCHLVRRCSASLISKLRSQ